MKNFNSNSQEEFIRLQEIEERNMLRRQKRHNRIRKLSKGIITIVTIALVVSIVFDIVTIIMGVLSSK